MAGEPGRIGPTPSQDPRLRMAVRLVLLGIAVVGIWFIRELRDAAPPPRPQVGSAATVLPVPKPLPDFRLTGDDGAPFARESLEGSWSFVFFGYTNCPSICPLTLGAMRDLHGDLATGSPPLDDTQWVFISVDPARDDPERLQTYVRHFDPAFRGAMGEPDQLERLTRELGVFHQRTPGGSEAAYDFDHTASLLLIDPDAQLHAVFSPPIDPAAAADAFRAIRRAAGS